MDSDFSHFPLDGTMTKGQYFHLKEIVKDARKSPRLTDFEKRFIDDMQRRLDTYGDRATYSDKQEAVIQKIEEKLYASG
jgi:hypothetical protein